MNRFALGLAAFCLLATAQPAAAMQDSAGAALLTVADRSFSAIPFGSAAPPEGLTSVDPARCESEGECAWRDAAGVEHSYWEGELVVKSVAVSDVGDRAIAALGIGSARSMADVIPKVQAFLPDAAVTCDEVDAVYVCGAMLGEGWFRLFFDASGRLTEARLDAYHFT